MKNTILFTTIFFLCAASGFAQKKLFKDAIEAGRQPNKFYVMHNDKNKKVTLKNLMEYAKENDIILGKSTEKEISRFGDVDTSVETIEFLPKSEYPLYVLANIYPEKARTSSTTPQQCPTFFFMVSQYADQKLVQDKNFYWYGNVTNGLAQGNGIGYTIKDNLMVFSIGNYVNGFPEGTVETVVYTMTGDYTSFGNDIVKRKGYLGKMSEDRASILKDNLLGFVDNSGNIVIQPKYQKVVKNFEGGKAIVQYEDREIIINKTGEFVDYSDHQKQLLAQASDICKQAIDMAEGNGMARNLVQSTELFKKAAELGDAEAQFRLARCYFPSGYGVKANSTLADKWFEKAAKGGNVKAMLYYGGYLESQDEMAKAQEQYRNAFSGISKLAQQGDAEGQFYLGLCYENGKGVTKDYAKAVEWFSKAAEQGNDDAQCNLGRCYENGKGVTQDYAKAVEWYSKAAEQGNTDAQNNLGYCYQYGNGVTKDYAKAVEWYRKAAEEGDASAQVKLGRKYEKGEGVTKDRAKAAEWFRKAGEQGNSEGQYELGGCYYYGSGVTQDYAKAVEWYRKAAEQGYADAQYSLGYCYDKGEGVTQDYAKAVEWYKKAAAQGDAFAQCNLGLCYENGNGVTQDYTKAAEWYRKAAEQGNAPAQYNLGNCYYYGKGVTKDYAKAVEWYRKAAEQGYADAQYSLGYCYDKGEGVTQDYAKAAEWYKKAAAQGDAFAQCNLGLCYDNGNGVTKDNAKAVEWYKKAAAQGNAQAQYNLGYCYQYGNGVTKNYAKALEWYKKAAAQGHANAQKGIESVEYYVQADKLKNELTQLTKRLGYNPDKCSTLGELVRVGASLSALKDYFLYSGAKQIWGLSRTSWSYDFILKRDSGYSKLYSLYELWGRQVAWVWVYGDKISSISWINRR